MEKLHLFTRFGDDAPVAIADGLIALAAPAIDEKNVLILGANVLLPTRDVVAESLDEIAQKAGLAIVDTLDGKRVAISPGGVARVYTEPGLIGQSFVVMGVPGVKPLAVRASVTEVVEYLNGFDTRSEVLAGHPLKRW